MAATLVTAQSLITSALDTLGVYAVGEALSASDATDGLRRLNGMMSAWKIQTQTIPAIQRSVFDITANVGTYTIGPGATFNTIKPQAILAASILLNASSPAVEVPTAILTDQVYAGLAIKGQTSTQWTAIWYNPTFVTSGYGTIVLWPIPTTADNDLVLYMQTPLTEFADLTTQYQIPDGYQEAIELNLALRLALPHARPISDDLKREARSALANIKRHNTKMSDLANDAIVASYGVGRWGYNIETDGYN